MTGLSPAVRQRLAAALARSAMLALALALSGAVMALLGLSYRSVAQWRRSAQQLDEHKADMMLTLLSQAINRDMRGAQMSVLLPLELDDIRRDPPYEVRETFARAFARFPYAESFFLWKTDGAMATFYTFHRDDRPPPWDAARRRLEAYPVVLKRNPEAGRPLANELRRRATAGSRFIVFDYELAQTPYQIVAKLLPGSAAGGPAAIVGFTVNLPWVRAWYFSQLASEISRIGDVSIPLAITDAEGVRVAATRPLEPGSVLRQRRFSPIFFDPVMLSSLAPATSAARPWTAMVGTADDEVLIAATRGTYLMLTLAAGASIIGVLLTARAVRTRARLTAVQAEFVSTVTHELKTPLAFIRLLGETLGKGRYDSLDTIRDYARLLSQEAWRLTQLVENLLTYARLSGQNRRRAFEALEVAELVDDAVSHFRPVLTEQAFEVVVDLPSDLPRLVGDRTTLTQILDNLVDNAIKYSEDRRSLTISSWLQDSRLWLVVADRGSGIAADELPQVFEKFFRGRGMRAGGSGLGLAIVKRVMEEHRGSVEIMSVPGEGTAVRLVFPLEGAHEQTGTGRRR